jgi:hypothetical protein
MVFWLWLAVSVVVLIGRRVRRASASPVRDAGPTPTATADAPVPPPAPSPSDPAVAFTGSAPVVPDGIGPAGTEPDAEPEPAPAVVPPPPPPDGAGRAADLAGALDGINLPCDLAPLTLGAAELDPDHVDLVTTGVAAREVTEELRRELGRLGYEVTDLGAGEHQATREETSVRFKIHDRPAVSVAADGRGFPTAPPDGLVVELTLA